MQDTVLLLQVLSCSAEEVLSQRAYMLFYSRLQPRPSLPDLAAQQAAAARAAPAAAAVAHSRVLNGHAEDEAAALTTADRSRVAASPWQSSYYSEEPASVLPYSNGGACSHASGSPAAADSCRALSAGVAALNLEEGTAVQAAGDCSHEGLDSALVDVFESRGLCRGEHPAGPAVAVPVKSF